MLDPQDARGARGQILPLVAFAIVCFFGVSALVIDLGYWRYEQRMQQGAADSGAMAGANALPYATASASPNPVQSSAWMDTAANGFTNGSNGVTVTVNSPPLTGPNAGNTSGVEVIVRRSVPHFFAGIFGRTSQSVSARAVALRGTASRTCIYALGTTGTPLDLNNATISMPQCGIITNGALLANNSNVTALSFGRAGANQNQSGSTYDINGNSSATPAPAAIVSDPCPTIPGCAAIAANPPVASPSPPATPLPLITPGSSGYNYNDTATSGPGGTPGLTFNPGRYPSQININAGTGAGTVTFNAGTYDFEGGANFNSGIPQITGTGVTFFVNGGSFNIDSGAYNLSAPSSGPYEGVLIYSKALSNFAINHGTPGPNGSFAGMVYVPNATLAVDGNLSTWTCLVANSIILNSDSTINTPSSAFPGITVKPASLVE